MGRKKRYIKGKVYYTNDRVLVGGKGKRRRVVSMGNDKKDMAVRRILSLEDKDGRKKERLIPISRKKAALKVKRLGKPLAASLFKNGS